MSTKSFSKTFYLTLISTTLFISTYYLVLPVLPVHMKLMGTSNFVIGLIMGMFSVSSLILRPLAGQASDKKGPVKIMRLSIFVFFLTPLFFLYDSLYLIAIVQLVYGFTVGAFTISSATVITLSVPKERLTEGIGIHSISLILAKGLAPTIGTYIYNFAGLYLLILLTIILAIASLIITSKIIDIEPLNKNNDSIIFIKVLSHRMVLIPSIVLLTVTLTFGSIMTMLPLLAIERGIVNFSLFFLMNTFAVVLIRLITGKQDRLTNNGIISISLIFLFIAVAIISITRNLPLLLVAAFIYGLGYGAVYPALSTLVVINTPLEIRGSAFGLFTAFFDVGVTLGSLWGGFSEYYSFTIIFATVSIIPLLGLLLILISNKKAIK